MSRLKHAAMMLAGTVLVAVPAQAQTARSYAKVTDTPSLSNPCGPLANGPTLGGSTANCGTVGVTNGVASTYATANNAARNVNSTSATQQLSGGPDTYAALANANATIFSALSLSGTSGAGDKLVFRFTGSYGFSATGPMGPNPSFGAISAQLQGFDTGANFTLLGFDPAYADPVLRGSNYTLGPNAFDFTVGFSSRTGTSLYYMTLGTEARGSSEGYTNGAGYANVNATLQGIDWFNSSNQRLGEATFFEDGTATLDVVQAPVPEPATLVLFATGAVVIGAVARRRRA